MADISKITLPSGTTYDIKDAAARASINGIFVIAWNGSSTPSLNKIPKDVVVKYGNTSYTGTLDPTTDTLGKFYLVKATSQGNDQETLDIYDEYVTYALGTNPETYAWEKIGDTQIKLTAMVTGVTLNKQTSSVIGNDATLRVSQQPTFSVTPNTTYIAASASGGAVSASGDNVTVMTGIGTPDKQDVLKSVTVGSKKLQTTAIRGVQDSVDKASKATAATSQTTAKGTGTASSTNTDWLKGVSVNNEVLTIGAATMDTQTTTQFTFADVDVPKKNSNTTTVANGSLVATSNTTNVGDTLVATVTTPNTDKVGVITDIPSPTTDEVVGTSSTFNVTNPTISLSKESSSATGRIQIANTGAVTASRTKDVTIAWDDKNTQTVLNDSTTITVDHPS